MSQEDIAENTFDVFLCYNREDEAAVKKIGEQLRKKGIAAWLDMWEIPPGRLWQQEIIQQIKHIPAAAVFVGGKGIGPWQQNEINTLLIEAQRRECYIIPVILEDAPAKPDLPLFLEQMQWVDFRVLKEMRNLSPDEEPLARLIWGIRGKRPWENRSHVLIALLGDSPVAVSSMYYLLTKQKDFTIDEVIVLQPLGEDGDKAYNLVKKAIEKEQCEVRNKLLPFEEANTWLNACLYLKELYDLLDVCQLRGDSVLLSLADGRKSMSALMAWIVPFFSCIKQLYYIIDPDGEKLLPLNHMFRDMTAADREKAMRPANLEQLKLVKIPTDTGQQFDGQSLKRLLAATKEDFEKMQYERAESIELLQTVAQPGNILEAHVTARVMKQFNAIYQQDTDAARHLRDCLERMRDTTELRSFQSDSFRYKPPKLGKRSSPPVDLYSFQSFGTPIRPIFYTLPRDIYNAFLDDVERVVICELDMGENGEYRSLQEIAESPGFSIEIAATLETLPVVPPDAQVESVLIVPLGISPMVATQLCTLLQRQEGRIIRKVILLYPGQSAEIANGAELIELALLEETDVACRHVAIPDMEDIDDGDKCLQYQKVLEEEIDRVRDELREKQLDWTIDLALSGGRKGMTAMTIFAAQNKQLPYVYHTLITNQKINDKIDEETTVGELKDSSREERNDRLFLRAYERERPEGAEPLFILFKVPVFSADKR